MVGEATGATAAASTTARFISMSLGSIADLITITQYLFSTLEPEVHQIYEYTYDMRQNLIRLMDAIEGADYKLELPEKQQNKFEEYKEKINEGIKFLEESETYNRTGMALWEYNQAQIALTREVMKSIGDAWNLFEKKCEELEGFYEKYPFTSPLLPDAKMEDGQETEETDLAAADTGQLVASMQQLGEKIDLVNFSPEASYNLQEGQVMREDDPNILNRLVAIDEKLNTFAMQDVEAQAEIIAGKIVEKTGGAVSPEEKVADMISGETENLPEQHKEMLSLLGQNQSIMYSYKDQLLRLENMIQTKALSFDQIYRKVIKRMWDDYKCGG